MFRKMMIALCASVALAAVFGSAVNAQTNSQERCIRGEESAASAYPAWMQC